MCCKSGPSYDDVKVELQGVHSQFEDVNLEPNPAYGVVLPSNVQTTINVAIEENPAYQSADSQPYDYVVGVTSSDVAMEKNPAYQSLDTTAPQTEEPEYL